MNKIKQALRRFLAMSEQATTTPGDTRQALSRQDVLRLVAANKLSPTQAGAVLRKRFRPGE
jgi:hypothetical protein